MTLVDALELCTLVVVYGTEFVGDVTQLLVDMNFTNIDSNQCIARTSAIGYDNPMGLVYVVCIIQLRVRYLGRNALKSWNNTMYFCRTS